MHDAIVIGGGISGLTAAEALHAAKQDCLLCEPERLGGVLRTDLHSGYVLEQGPNVFIEKAPFRKYLEHLGLEPEVIYSTHRSYRQQVWYAGAPVDVPQSPVALLSCPLAPLSEKLGTIARVFKPGVLRSGAQDESVYDFVQRLTGKALVDHLVDPALKGIYGGDARKLSARTVFPGLWETAQAGGSVFTYMRQKRRAPIMVLRGGNQSLADRVAAGLPAESIIRQAVVGVEGAGTAHSFKVRLASGELIQSRRLLIATSGPATAAYLRGLAPELSRSLESINYASLVVAQCSISKSQPVPKAAFGVLFPSGQSSRLLGIMYKSELFPSTAPTDRHLLTLCLGGLDSAEFCRKDDIELRELVLQELKSKCGFSSPEVLALYRWERAIPQYEVGHWRILSACRALERELPGLHFVGVDQGGIGVPDRVAAALDVVASISMRTLRT